MNFSNRPTEPQNGPGNAGFGPAAANHLDQKQIDDHLIGAPSPAATAHLAGCDLCGSRVAEAAAPLAAFQAVSLAWSERRSATMPLHQSLARASTIHPRLAWAAAALVGLAVGIAVPTLSHQQREQTAHTSRPTPVQTASSSPPQPSAPASTHAALPSSSQAARPLQASGHSMIGSQIEMRAQAENPLQTPAQNSALNPARSGLSDQIVQDNRILRAIDRELDASAETPAALGLLPVGGVVENRKAPPSLQD